MRRALAMTLSCALASCIEGEERPAPCTADEYCSAGEVCASSSRCLPPAALRTVTTSWTLDGAPASAATCAATAVLGIGFEGMNGGYLHRQDVSCESGMLTVDRVPLAYDTVVMKFVEPRDASAPIVDGRAQVDFRR